MNKPKVLVLSIGMGLTLCACDRDNNSADITRLKTDEMSAESTTAPKPSIPSFGVDREPSPDEAAISSENRAPPRDDLETELFNENAEVPNPEAGDPVVRQIARDK